MEYVQAVLAQMEATRLDDALRPRGLLDELDEHRRFLQEQRGFQDLRVVRSINREGQVQLVVETRWEDDESLLDYETREPNVMGIMRKHQDLLVPGSLQVLDMEALRAETPGERVITAAEVKERVVFPLLIPAAALAFALLVIYGLSRIYLEIRSEEVGDLTVATPLAAGIAGGILLVAWYLASHPRITGGQIASIAAAAVALLLGAVIFVTVHEEGGGEEAVAETGVASPTATVSPAPGGGVPGGLSLEQGDNFFNFPGQRQRNPTISAALAQTVTFDVVNKGNTIHNLRIAGIDGKYNTSDDFVSDPDAMRAGQTGKITFKIDQPGSYLYRCDFHPTEMKGKLEVR